MNPPLVSWIHPNSAVISIHHLPLFHLLIEAGLVTQERRGTYSIYAIREEALVSLQAFLDACKGSPVSDSAQPMTVLSDI